ncbi:C40 family peptidase [Jeotgalibacillus haloalkalitolerans]|uniref:LysM peptidoglycan-binding domain-containing protein n=1 Tax=Jeotgalibacillus haloalkalitolerans TaxID=3104292 RepID=A0ABU5KJJ5_9BACL|nr:LysM peptidoglycan-binding domain-containing protein [Jeotgalibacillus sp. HH7-29]MDZ5711429.1 LysM peptidoglycan-binding domain-containing protein [Jeotgalibacillus sp. HH7-29]
MKKWVRTAVATTAIAATISGLGSQAFASTYKVSSGDTLWKIALENQTSVNQIKQLNDLTSDIIFPNQLLKLSGEAVSSSNTGSTTSVSGSTYVVKAGDTLYGIALKTNTSLSSIRSLNNLTSHLIYPGQSLKLEGSVHTSSNSSDVSSSSGSSSSSNTSTYTVKSGDYLSKIAVNHGISLSELMNLNGLSGYLIYPGQTLKVTGTATNVSSGPAQTSQKQTSAVSGASAIIQKAKAQIGTPYVWGGTSTSGFDCSGFISYVFDTSRTSAAGYYSRSSHVSSPQPGDLVFFKNTYKAGISHVGIYVGGNQFVHAGNNGVEVTSLSNPYWSSKFDSYRSF